MTIFHRPPSRHRRARVIRQEDSRCAQRDVTRARFHSCRLLSPTMCADYARCAKRANMLDIWPGQPTRAPPLRHFLLSFRQPLLIAKL